jgi:hypothetical protein
MPVLASMLVKDRHFIINWETKLFAELIEDFVMPDAD